MAMVNPLNRETRPFFIVRSQALRLPVESCHVFKETLKLLYIQRESRQHDGAERVDVTGNVQTVLDEAVVANVPGAGPPALVTRISGAPRDCLTSSSSRLISSALLTSAPNPKTSDPVWVEISSAACLVAAPSR